MAFYIADRVLETTSTTGTGTVSLNGAVLSYQSFSSAIGDGNTTYYTITLDTSGEWEVGIGTYTASGSTLSRDTVLASSNGGSLVNFSAGSKNVFVTYPASKAILASDNPGSSGQYLMSNGTGVAPTWETLAGMTYPGAGIPLSTGSAWGTSFNNSTNPVSVSYGGTGLTSLTAGYIPFGNGTSAFGNTSNLFWDSANARLGVGTSSPSQALDITRSAASAYLSTTNGTVQTVYGTSNGASAGLLGTFTNHPQVFWTNNVERMRIDSSGNLGVGTTSPFSSAGYNSITVNGTSGGIFSSYVNGTETGRTQVYTGNYTIKAIGASTNMWFETNGSERMRITANGGISFGSSGTAYGTSGQVLQSNGDAPPSWTTLTATGDVSGPASATDNAIVRFDGTTGKLIQDSGITISDSGSLILGAALDEKVYAVSGTTPALSPSNGTIQTWTLSANSTPTAGTWNEGESMTLMVNDTASTFTVAWTSVPITWVGGSAPSLLPGGGYTVIELWKVGTTIYGALVGQVA